MPKIEITRELLNSIVNQNNKKFVKNVNKRVNEVLAESIDNLSAKVSYINLKNVVLQPVNELITNSFVDNSSFIYFLGIDNAQLELNTAKKMNFWRNFKDRLKFAWDNRKNFSRRRKKKRRKKLKYEESQINSKKYDPTKYCIYDLAEDMQHSISNYLLETSVITLYDNSIHIVGKEDFGSNTSIIIYFVNKSGNIFKYYAGRKKGFIEIDINSRIEKVNEKFNAVGENYLQMIKILNTLFYNVNNYMPNQIFIESVLNFCPDELYNGSDIYNVFLKIINYLNLKTIKNIYSIVNPTKTINNDVLCGHCGLAFNKMLNLINL